MGWNPVGWHYWGDGDFLGKARGDCPDAFVLMSRTPCTHSPAAPLPLKSAFYLRAGWLCRMPGEALELKVQAQELMLWQGSASCPGISSWVQFPKGHWSSSSWHPVMSAASWACSRIASASLSCLGKAPSLLTAWGSSSVPAAELSSLVGSVPGQLQPRPQQGVGGSLGAHQKYSGFFCPWKPRWQHQGAFLGGTLSELYCSDKYPRAQSQSFSIYNVGSAFV